MAPPRRSDVEMTVRVLDRLDHPGRTVDALGLDKLDHPGGTVDGHGLDKLDHP
jgi:hypothetical protein